jgi:aspartyl-tRNA(Asn)/glutamyl-tRNA(Gln) amidotransferase subunit A
MKLMINEGSTGAKNLVLDDLILTRDLPTTAGSKMLDGYKSLFEAEVVTRLKKAGYTVAGKTNVGEFGIDLLGETSYFGACAKEDGTLVYAANELLEQGAACAAVQLDAQGAPRRGAALSGQVFVKPTYGTVSRFGTISVACSGEAVGVAAKTAADCRAALTAMAGYDEKDGTSLPASMYKETGAVKKVAVITDLLDAADAATQEKIAAFQTFLESKGIACTKVENKLLTAAKTAWNALMTAELCNNVSRYDGVKYGYRTKNYTNIDELYTNSRTEAFGTVLKSAILLGSSVLSTNNYDKMYDKSMRIRRLLVEAMNGLFAEYDAVLIPACGKTAYTLAEVEANPYLAFEESLFTAPASITGMPAVVVGGVQLMGPAFSENSLLDVAESYEEVAK